MSSSEGIYIVLGVLRVDLANEFPFGEKDDQYALPEGEEHDGFHHHKLVQRTDRFQVLFAHLYISYMTYDKDDDEGSLRVAWLCVTQRTM